MSDRPLNKPRVAVVQEHFAHYRASVMQALFSSERYDVIAAADDRSPSGLGIKGWEGMPSDRFVLTRCRRYQRGFMLQRGLIHLALRRDLVAIIYAGNVKWPATWASALVARLMGKRVLFWTHGWRRRDGAVAGMMRRIFYRIAHGLLLYGHFGKMLAIEYGFDPDRLYVIYNSLDHEAQKAARRRITPERIAAIREELFPGSQRPMLACTMRLTANKRIDLLLEAMRVLRERGLEVDLLLVGDGPEREALEGLASEHGLSVCFYGACYDESRLAELIGSANAMVSPGAIGLTALHALAYGTPVVTHDDPYDQGPEFETVIPGRTGALYRNGDVSSLAEALEPFVRRRLPDESIRAACHEMIDRFWNPLRQRRVIEHALDGSSADDLLWQREPREGIDLGAAERASAAATE